MSAIELREKATRINMQARDLIASIAKDNLDETRAKEIDTQVDRMLADADALEARAAKLDAIEARERAYGEADPRRPVAESRQTASAESLKARHAEAFDLMIRGRELSSDHRAALNERRDLTVGTGAAGGYLVPTLLGNQIIQTLKAYGPMMDDSAVTHIETSTGATINFPTLNDTANMGRLVTEAGQINSVSLTFNQIALNAYKYTSDFFKVSSEAAQDSSFDVAGLIADTIGTRLGRVLNNDLTNGSGSAMPQGVLTSVGTPTLTTITNAAVSYADIINLEHSVDPLYRGNPKSSLMFSDNVLQAIRKLTDTQGHPLWEPSVPGGAPAKFAGMNYLINQSMPTLASGNVAILYGDFSKFWVRVAKNITLKYVDQRFADNDEVAWVGFVRVDGRLMDSAAIKGLHIS